MNSRTKAELILLACTIIWGSTFALVKGSLNAISPLLLITIRFSFAAAITISRNPKEITLITGKTVLYGIILGILLSIGFITQTIGLQYTTASKSGFLTGLLVIFTPIFQLFIERKMPGKGNLLGVVLVAIGLFFLTSPQGQEFNLGDFLTLICAVVYALYIVYLDIFSRVQEIPHLIIIFQSTTAVLSFAAAIVFEKAVFDLSIQLILVLFYLVVFATYLTLNWQARYQKFSTPTRAAVIFSLEPVFAAILAYFLLNEILGWLSLLGGGLIVAGLILSELSDVIFPKERLNENR